MNSVTRVVGTLAATAVMAMGSMVAVQANEPDTFEDRLEEISQVEEAVPVAESPIEPVGADGEVAFGAGSDSLAIHLPTLDGDGVVQEDGRYVVSAGDDADIAVAPLTDGTQILVGIESADAPTSYDFDIDAPEGFVPTLTEAGAVDVINPDGLLAATIEAPWAVDADGRNVPTRFEVDGASVKQIVDHQSEDFVYPVVADPKVFSCDWHQSSCVKFSKSETKTIRNKLTGTTGKTSGGVASYLCTRIPNIVAGAACIGTVIAYGSSMVSLFKNAAKNGKCAELHFLRTGGVLWKWKQVKC